jgi:Xaa-Pro aminopeptidase
VKKLKRLREQFEQYKLDGFLVTSEVNRRYLTGFHSSDGCLLVTRDSAYFFTDSRYIEAARAKIKNAEVKLTGTDGYKQHIESLCREENIGRLGFEDGLISYSAYNTWKNALNAELIPSQELLSSLRRVKTESEIGLLMSAQQITDEVFKDILGILAPGMTEMEIGAELQYRMLKKGAEGMSFPPIVVSGPNSSLPHGVPGKRELRRGDFVTMDFGCVFEGYCSDMTRTVVIGQATDEMRLVYDTVLRAQKAGIAAFREGITGAEVDMAAREVINSAGYGEYFGHGFGHGVGLDVHESPNASAANKDPLPKGAVISAEPGIYIPGRFGVRIEDVVVVTEDGCRDITKSPKELIEL